MARISLTHSRHFAGLLDYILCPHRAAIDKLFLGWPTLARPCEGVYRRTSLMSSFLFLQQCLTCFVRLICIVLEMGGRWPYSCFRACNIQDLFNIDRSILVHFPSSFFSIFLDSARMVHPYSIMDTTVTYSYARRNIVNTIKTSGHSSLEKYTSHFIRKSYERVYVWKVSWRLNKDCKILTPTLLAIAAFLSRSPGLFNRGPRGPASARTLYFAYRGRLF